MKRENIITGIRAALILLFFYAGVGKIAAPVQFSKDMFNQPFPHWFSAILIFLVPAAELCLAILLMPEKTSAHALKGSAVLMGLFTLYVAAIMLHFFKYVPCACTGFIRSFSWWQHLLFNLFFLAVAVTGVVLDWKKNKNQGHPKEEKQNTATGIDQKNISLSV